MRPRGWHSFSPSWAPRGRASCFSTGRPVSAERALVIGLVDQVVPAAELGAALTNTVADIIRAAPTAVAGTRAAITLLSGAPAPEDAATIERIRLEAYASAQFAEGLAAFRDHRPPRWAEPINGDGEPPQRAG